MSRLYAYFSGHASSTGTRLVLIVVLVVLVHLTVKAIRGISEWVINKSHAQKNPLGFVTQQPKFITLIQLIAIFDRMAPGRWPVSWYVFQSPLHRGRLFNL